MVTLPSLGGEPPQPVEEALRAAGSLSPRAHSEAWRAALEPVIRTALSEELRCSLEELETRLRSAFNDDLRELLTPHLTFLRADSPASTVASPGLMGDFSRGLRPFRMSELSQGGARSAATSVRSTTRSNAAYEVGEEGLTRSSALTRSSTRRSLWQRQRTNGTQVSPSVRLAPDTMPDTLLNDLHHEHKGERVAWADAENAGASEESRPTEAISGIDDAGPQPTISGFQSLSVGWRNARSFIPRAFRRPALRTLSERSGLGTNEGLARLAAFVASPAFENAVGILILCNAIVIGWQTQSEAQGGLGPNAVFIVINWFFSISFTIELLLRGLSLGSKFFWGRAWQWNVFDAMVIVLQLGGNIMSSWYPETSVHQGIGNITSLRLVRSLRVIWVLRVARILRRILELRTLITSILYSIKPLIWTLLLLSILIYIIGIYLTQLVTFYRFTTDVDPDARDLLDTYYGSLGLTVLSLFKSITNGGDWGTMCQPLVDVISPWMSLLWAGYIAFAVLAMLNVVTGVFVDTVLRSQAVERDTFMVTNAQELFDSLEGGSRSSMSWSTFESKLEAPQMREFFKAIDLDPSQAQGIFNLLDVDSSGSITADEFLSGALRLRGPARALDVALMMAELRYVRRHLHDTGSGGRTSR